MAICMRVCYLFLFLATCHQPMPSYPFYLRSTLTFSIQPFIFQISAAAGAQINLSAHCVPFIQQECAFDGTTLPHLSVEGSY